jgi:NTE family protein
MTSANSGLPGPDGHETADLAEIAAPFSTRHVTSLPDQAEPLAPLAGERALVLGGGGSAGNAWVIGVVAGLFEAGLDVTEADLVIGTSAGSTAAVQLLSTSPTDLLAAILDAPPPQRPGQGGAGGHGRPARPAVNHFERTTAVIAAASDPADMRRRLGASALGLDEAADASVRARWRATVAARLPGHGWPEQRLFITAVDAATGEPVVFDRDSRVDVVDAVAASCSSGPPYGIGGGQFIDGGYRRSSENADLAAGSARVLVLSPFGGRSRAPMDWDMHLAAQVEELRAGGSRVETILPDSAALEAFGDNMMDLSRRAPAARAGHDQGSALSRQLSKFWR